MSYYRNFIRDITDLVKNDPDPNSPYKRIPLPLFEATSHNGRILAIPLYWWTYNTCYNVDLWQEAALQPPAYNWTWEDFRIAARRMTKDTDGDGIPNIWGTATYSQWKHRIRTWLWSAGTDMYDFNTGRSTVNTPEAHEAWRFMYQLEVEDRSHMGWGVEGPDPVNTYSQGRVGMLLGNIYYSLPNETYGTTFEVATVPVGPKNSTTGVIVTTMALSPTTQHPEEAYKLAKFIVSPEAQRLARSIDADIAVYPPGDRQLAAEMFAPSSSRPYNKHLWIDVLPTALDMDRLPKGVTTESTNQVFRTWWEKVSKREISLSNALEYIDVELNALLSAE